MTCRTRSAALLAALLTSLVLLASVATAHAEGEWVLWAELTFSGGSIDSKRWEVQGAASSEKECQDRGTAEAMRRVKPGTGNSYLPELGGVLFTREDGQVGSVTRFVCLPDTVDPRGPKGK